jgi:peptide/nickel transport system substrate-binding protein
MPPVEFPSGTVTLLFTDIEGSTRLLKQLRDRYGDVLADHRRLLREAVAAHDGREIDTQGDAFFVAFRRARDAVAAAVEAQQAIGGHAWPDGAQVRVRMGIHTGEPSVGDEGYHGLGLHRGARICAAGHGGQILLSNATRELIEDELTDGLVLTDLGEKRLKDLDRPERIAQLDYPGMPAPFPPLKTLDAQPAEAPFGGQEAELAEAVATRFGWVRRRRRGTLALAAAGAAAAVVAAVLLLGGDEPMRRLTADSLGIISSDGHELVAAVPVGTNPSGVAAGDGDIWVANADDQTVSRIDASSHRVVQTIDVGSGPTGVALAGGFVWVVNSLDNSVSQIDPKVGGGRVIREIAAGNQPSAIAGWRDAVWVANAADSTVTRIDARTGRASAPVKAGGGADAIAVGPGGVWVASTRGGTVTELDPSSARPLRPVPVGQGPAAVAVGAGAVWVSNTLDGTVSKIDPERASVVTTIPVGREPRGLAVGRTSVWVSDESGRISEIDAAKATVVHEVLVGNRPSAVALSGRSVLVTLRASGPAHRGGVLRIATTGEGFDSIDPALAYYQLTWDLVSVTNDGLVAFRRGSGAGGAQLVPDLATSLPRPAEDGRAYTFRLRRGLHYSDGRPVRASDIRHAIERNYAIPLSPGPSFYGTIVGASACAKRGTACDLSRGIETDDRAGTVTVRLTQPDPDILYKLALPTAFAVPGDTPRKAVEDGSIPATGPYKFARADRKKVSFELVRNPRFDGWSDAARPDGYPDRIEIHGHLEPRQQVAAVERGTADFAFEAFAAGVPTIERLRTQRASQVHLSPGRSTEFVFLNTRLRPFDDVRVRRAINFAVDRAAGRSARAPTGVPTCQLLPPGFVGYRRYCPFGRRPDLAEARRLVAASKTRGARITIRTPAEQSIYDRTQTVIRAMRTLGYRVRVRRYDTVNGYFVYVNDFDHRVQAGWMGWVADYPAPNGFVTALFGCGSPSNYARFCDRGTQALIRRAGQITGSDPDVVGDHWARVDRRLTDLAPTVPLSNPVDFSFVSERVRNFQYHPQWGVLLDQLWVR